ncbi:endo-1,4-beta-xylanase [Segatella hominis]|uniref:endo-1,4-beta-xylanase n=1 Tax=Segatella hominis TaxID=2518605 RepID=UPI003AB9A0F6
MNKQILVSALGAMLLASCADHFDQNFETVRPGKEAQYGYLEQYDALKEYIKDRPNFHLGIGTAVDEYNKQELVYALTNSNFNETVAGNAMKMSSCVADDGSMNFDKVSEYVKKATDAGLSVYGHTLAWHAQQPNKYLNGLIAPKEIEVDPDAKVEKTDYELDCSTLSDYDWHEYPASVHTEFKKDGAVVITNSKPIDNWTLQYWLVNGISLKAGTKYKITFLCKAEGESPANIHFKLGNWGGGAEENFTIPVGGDYKEVPFEVTPTMDSNGLFFQHGQFVGKIYWKSVKITHSEAPSKEIFTDCISNGEMKTGGDMSNFVVREAGKGDVDGTPIAGGPDGKNCVVVHANANASNEWDTQFFIYTPNKTWSAGDKYKITFYYKASEKIGADTQCHGEPGAYKHYACLNPNPSFTTQWQKYESNGTIPAEADGMKAIAFNLNKGKKDHAIDYYFADIHWGTVEKGNKKPLTPDEKKEILTPVLQNWIYGMMEATEGKVKAWDVVNEAISGKDTGEFYPLQSATRGTVSADDAKNNFYWQDYLGDIDYVRTAVAAARKGFADAGGNPEELKLFINDYNLETAYDQNKKLKSLIHWIEEWEKDGVTKIDGIGSQMHVSCSMDPAEQKRREDAYVNMLNLMVASHKLVRISELDMGLEDKNGNQIKTTDMTEEQHEKMRAYYEFIVKKYLEIVPENQQWGICQWCVTDSPANSGWRAGLPVGLWDLDYYRKHTYGGFAAGLGAPEYWNDAK